MKRKSIRKKFSIAFLILMLPFFLALYIHAEIYGPPAAVQVSTDTATHSEEFHFFSFITSDRYDLFEKVMLWVVLATALGALLYALMLVGQVKRAATGTPKMKAVADATREGANAYLSQQFKRIVLLIVVITAILFLTKIDG